MAGGLVKLCLCVHDDGSPHSHDHGHDHDSASHDAPHHHATAPCPGHGERGRTTGVEESGHSVQNPACTCADLGQPVLATESSSANPCGLAALPSALAATAAPARADLLEFGQGRPQHPRPPPPPPVRPHLLFSVLLL